jgi:uncharacterized OB-fold protein
MFYNKKPVNKYRTLTYEKEETSYYGASCPVCGKMLSKQRPICFSCPIHSAEYYEKRKQNRENNQI